MEKEMLPIIITLDSNLHLPRTTSSAYISAHKGYPALKWVRKWHNSKHACTRLASRGLNCGHNEEAMIMEKNYVLSHKIKFQRASGATVPCVPSKLSYGFLLKFEPEAEFMTISFSMYKTLPMCSPFDEVCFKFWTRPFGGRNFQSVEGSCTRFGERIAFIQMPLSDFIIGNDGFAAVEVRFSKKWIL